MAHADIILAATVIENPNPFVVRLIICDMVPTEQIWNTPVTSATIHT